MALNLKGARHTCAIGGRHRFRCRLNMHLARWRVHWHRRRCSQATSMIPGWLQFWARHVGLMEPTPQRLAACWRQRIGEQPFQVQTSLNLMRGRATKVDVEANVDIIDGVLDVFPTRTPGCKLIADAIDIFMMSAVTRPASPTTRSGSWAMQQAVMLKAIVSRLRTTCSNLRIYVTVLDMCVSLFHCSDSLFQSAKLCIAPQTGPRCATWRLGRASSADMCLSLLC